MIPTKQRPLRADETLHFERLVPSLAALSDDELYALKARMMSNARLHVDQRREEGDDNPWYHPVVEVEMALVDTLTNEINYRLSVIWNVDSELRGGHQVHIDVDSPDLGTFQALCWPEWDENGGGRTCWEGPARTTLEEAVEDGRRHNPGFEPYTD